jgi:pimeloyl-ACP methyl ester carboxylesterase
MGRGLKIVLLVLAALVALLVVNAWLLGRETRDAKAEGGRIVKLAGGDLHVVDEGPRDARRAPVVLLHGATGSVRWWGAQAAALRGERRVVRVDGLGNGGSEAPRDGYEVPEQADLIAAALRRLGVRRAVLGGYSAGGTIATALALRHPDLVRALVVVDTSPARRWFDYTLANRLAVAPLVGPALRRVLPRSAVRRGYDQVFAPGFDAPEWAVDDYYDTTYTSYREPRQAQLDFLDEKPLPERLSARRLPLLVLFGDRDRLVDPDATSAWRKVPGARVEVVRGAGHTPIVERPAESTRLLRAFLTRVDR